MLLPNNIDDSKSSLSILHSNSHVQLDGIARREEQLNLLYFLCGQIPPGVTTGKRNEEAGIVSNWLPVDARYDPLL